MCSADAYRHFEITWEALYRGLELVKGLLIYPVWERWQVAHIKQVLPVEIVIQIFIARFVLSEIASLKRILKQSD